ncbi:hypothetical protein M8J76_011565 [Diaphorina citri]|nr:hypothetical protein M8J76_011565 [Diaphorina citri]
MWQTGGMGGGTHAQNNPWMKLMGKFHKDRRHHDSSATTTGDRLQDIENYGDIWINEEGWREYSSPYHLSLSGT